MSGDIFVVSGPSGAGKGTLLDRVMPHLRTTWLSVSVTTRAPRTGEQEGVHYFFKSNEEFDSLILQDGMLEWAQVHSERYGTLRSEVEDRIAAGIDVILEIDPQGALQVRAKIPKAILVFIAPPSIEELERRLKKRGTENDAVIQRRMKDSVELLKYRDRYQHVIINNDLDKAADEFLTLLRK